MLWTPMLAGIAGASFSAPVPGAMPAHSTVAGTLFTNLTLAGTRDIAIPTHTNGDLLLLAVHMREQGTPSTIDFTSINTAGWTQVGGAGNEYGVAANISKIGFGWKIGNGTETVVNITTAGGTSSDRIQARVHRFTATNGFAATPVQGITAVDSNGANVSSLGMPSLTASGLRELAVAIVAQSSNVTIAAATGGTGGTWTEPVAEDAGTLGVMGVQTAGLASGGTIAGASVSYGGSGHAVIVGFTIVPALV